MSIIERMVRLGKNAISQVQKIPSPHPILEADYQDLQKTEHSEQKKSDYEGASVIQSSE